MRRVNNLQTDARRARSARRGRSASARVALPLLAAVVVITGTATVAAEAGLSVGFVAALTFAVALAGGIVARRTVDDVVAGLGMFVVRPYAAGEVLRLHAPDDDAAVEATVVRVGPVNTTLATRDGLLLVANTRLLRGLPVIVPAAATPPVESLPCG